MKVIIDSGHGGSDPGASAFGTLEKDLNLIFAELLALKLKKSGIDTDISLIADKYYTPAVLTDLIKKSGANLCISCHNNSYNGSAKGFEAIHSVHTDGRLAVMIAEKIRETGHTVRRTFSRNSTNPARPDDDYYYIIRLTYPKVETVILEFGFIDNPEDYKKITDKAWQEKLTTAAASAIAGYIRPDAADGQAQPLTHWAKESHDELLKAGILKADHTATLDKPATEGMVFSLINRLRKEMKKDV